DVRREWLLAERRPGGSPDADDRRLRGGWLRRRDRAGLGARLSPQWRGLPPVPRAGALLQHRPDLERAHPVAAARPLPAGRHTLHRAGDRDRRQADRRQLDASPGTLRCRPFPNAILVQPRQDALQELLQRLGGLIVEVAQEQPLDAPQMYWQRPPVAPVPLLG